jgi:hypothetical protein
LRDDLRQLFDDLDRMRVIGAPISDPRIAKLALTRSILAMLREGGLVLDIVPPGQQHDLKKITDMYMAAGEAWASKILGDAPALRLVESA